MKNRIARFLLGLVGGGAGMALGFGFMWVLTMPEGHYAALRKRLQLALGPVPVKVVTGPCVEKPDPRPRAASIKVGPVFVVGEKRIQRIAIAGRIMSGNDHQILGALQLAENEGVTDLEVAISSDGGDLNAAMVMTAAFSTVRMRVYCVVPFSARSAAFMLLQGCDSRAALPAAKLMEHRPFAMPPSGTGYRSDDLRSIAESLDDIERMMVEVFAERGSVLLGHSKTEIADTIKIRIGSGNWDMTPAEAIDFGFLDVVVADMKAFQAMIEVP